MVSTYGYTTLAKLEEYGARDYSAIDSTLLADAKVDKIITYAEIFINTYIGTIYTSTIPPGIELVTNMISKIFLDNFMIERNIGEILQVNGGTLIDILDRTDIILLLEQYKAQYNATQSVFISKHMHTARSTIFSRRPYGW